jgi:D-sedoheptulose 7-phosphate isomerase
VLEAFADSHAGAVAELAEVTARSLKHGGKLLAFGNGGSAAEAQHLACELVNRFRVERPPLAGLALTSDTSALTAISNDYGFDSVFEKQVRALARSGDVAVGFTTSGRSPNVLRGLREAREIGCVCVGLTGDDPEVLRETCDHLFCAPSHNTPHIQECHAVFVHALCDLIDEILYPEGPS